MSVADTLLQLGLTVGASKLQADGSLGLSLKTRGGFLAARGDISELASRLSEGEVRL